MGLSRLANRLSSSLLPRPPDVDAVEADAAAWEDEMEASMSPVAEETAAAALIDARNGCDGIDGIDGGGIMAKAEDVDASGDCDDEDEVEDEVDGMTDTMLENEH